MPITSARLGLVELVVGLQLVAIVHFLRVRSLAQHRNLGMCHRKQMTLSSSHFGKQAGDVDYLLESRTLDRVGHEQRYHPCQANSTRNLRVSVCAGQERGVSSDCFYSPTNLITTSALFTRRENTTQTSAWPWLAAQLS
jgi:hypothetical protein